MMKNSQATSIIRRTLFESDEIQIGSFEANPGLDSFSLIVIAPNLSWHSAAEATLLNVIGALG